MVEFQGFWLNLDDFEGRASWMHSRLRELRLSAKYERVVGVVGDEDQALLRGLKPGEWGAWQGWLRLLDRASQSSALFVHLMEDDVDISDLFLDFVSASFLKVILSQGKIVCTDAYISPYQCLDLLRAMDGLRCTKDKWLVMESGCKIPCLNSLLLSPDTAKSLHAKLRAVLECQDRLSPIDIAISEVSQDWCAIAPFVTAPKLNLSSRGGIREHNEVDFQLSRDALTLLRRALFCKENDLDLRFGIANLMVQLIEIDVLKPY